MILTAFEVIFSRFPKKISIFQVIFSHIEPYFTLLLHRKIK